MYIIPKLPRDVGKWFGLEYPDPAIGEDEYGPIFAITANDVLGWKFGNIAKSIEKYYQL